MDDDSTRRAVEELYDDHPYPDHGVVSTVVYRLATDLIDAAKRRVPDRPIRILDAGCGTGEQTLGIARAVPDADVTGIDLSRRSLERAEEYRRRHRLGARFARADLLEALPEELGRFDVIVSVGVLHHLTEPDRALRNLSAVAEPEATVLGMVYGRYGRWDTLCTRDALAALGPDDTRTERLEHLAGIRRSRLGQLAEKVAELQRRRRYGPRIGLNEALRRTRAGRNQAYLADCFTHSHELTYTWDELATMLADNGWTCGGWPKRSGMPDAPEQLLTGTALERARSLSLIEQAAVYERLLRPANLFFEAGLTRSE